MIVRLIYMVLLTTLLFSSCRKENRKASDMEGLWTVSMVEIHRYDTSGEVTIDTIRDLGTIELIDLGKNQHKSKAGAYTNKAYLDISNNGSSHCSLERLADFPSLYDYCFWDIEMNEEGYSRLQFHTINPLTAFYHYISYTVVEKPDSVQQWIYYEFEDGFDNRLNRMEIVYVRK